MHNPVLESTSVYLSANPSGPILLCRNPSVSCYVGIRVFYYVGIPVYILLCRNPCERRHQSAEMLLREYHAGGAGGCPVGQSRQGRREVLHQGLQKRVGKVPAHIFSL